MAVNHSPSLLGLPDANHLFSALPGMTQIGLEEKWLNVGE
jgi:hypothetical protein